MMKFKSRTLFQKTIYHCKTVPTKQLQTIPTTSVLSRYVRILFLVIFAALCIIGSLHLYQ